MNTKHAWKWAVAVAAIIAAVALVVIVGSNRKPDPSGAVQACSLLGTPLNTADHVIDNNDGTYMLWVLDNGQMVGCLASYQNGQWSAHLVF